jgi:P-type conjugative transfer protein TrbJ
MKPRMIVAAMTAASLFVATPAQSQFGGVVFDPRNYAQNVLTAARTLQQINNQIQSLQNEATMLENMGRNLKTLDFNSLQQIRSSLQRIGTLMNQADGIALNVSATNAALDASFPRTVNGALSTDQAVAQAQTQWQAAMDGWRQTLRVQAQVAQNLQNDAPLLASLVSSSQGAQGALQAQQAANQLTALSIQQQMQLQTMMAAQYRADAIERARQAQALETARQETQRFIGTADIYTRR